MARPIVKGKMYARHNDGHIRCYDVTALHPIPKPSPMRAKFLISLLALLPTLVLCAVDKTALIIANSDYGEHPLPEAKANVGKLQGAGASRLHGHGEGKHREGSHFRKELETYATTCPNGGVSRCTFADTVAVSTVRWRERSRSRTARRRSGTPSLIPVFGELPTTLPTE